LPEIAGKIAGLVDEIDQVLPDHAPCWVGDRERQLLGEVIGERGLGRDEGFEIVLAVSTAGAGAGPFGIAGRGLAVRARARRIGVGGRNVFEIGDRALAHGGAVGAIGGALAPVIGGVGTRR
jgi:hypothetical protein